MSTSGQKTGRPPLDAARQLERAHRILDAAGDLILRWGYDKTTIEDVARRAEVAKGTIYLHWRTREELFTALLRRERVHMLDEVGRRVAGTGATLHDLVGCLAQEMLSRPLVKASIVGDSEVLGKLTRGKLARGQEADPAGFEPYFAELQAAGGLRDDMTPDELVHVVLSVINGFLLSRRSLPEERLAQLLAETAARAVEPARPPADARPVARATENYIEYARAVAERKLQASLGTKEGVR